MDCGAATRVVQRSGVRQGSMHVVVDHLAKTLGERVEGDRGRSGYRLGTPVVAYSRRLADSILLSSRLFNLIPMRQRAQFWVGT